MYANKKQSSAVWTLSYLSTWSPPVPQKSFNNLTEINDVWPILYQNMSFSCSEKYNKIRLEIQEKIVMSEEKDNFFLYLG